MPTSLFLKNRLYRSLLLGASLALEGSLSSTVLAVDCSSLQWQEGSRFQVGQEVVYRKNLYRALVTHTAWAGAGWTPLTESLWTLVGPANCDHGDADGANKSDDVDNPGDNRNVQVRRAPGTVHETAIQCANQHRLA